MGHILWPLPQLIDDSLMTISQDDSWDAVMRESSMSCGRGQTMSWGRGHRIWPIYILWAMIISWLLRIHSHSMTTMTRNDHLSEVIECECILNSLLAAGRVCAMAVVAKVREYDPFTFYDLIHWHSMRGNYAHILNRRLAAGYVCAMAVGAKVIEYDPFTFHDLIHWHSMRGNYAHILNRRLAAGCVCAGCCGNGHRMTFTHIL